MHLIVINFTFLVLDHHFSLIMFFIFWIYLLQFFKFLSFIEI